MGRGGRRHLCRRKKQPTLVDSISSLPDDILKHIICFVPTRFAIRTSVLSKRWRHVWCDTPSLFFDIRMKGAYINETLKRYTALKMRSFHFYANGDSIDYVNMWIEFAMSRNVENLSFHFWLHNGIEFEFPVFFYNNSSVKQLTVNSLYSPYMNPTCSVSWTSLKRLSLSWCKLSDESIAKILSGCPIMESLTLHSCKELSFLDLSKYSCLRTLRVYNAGATQIVAPHIHCLKLMNSSLSPYTLLDVSSLNEAKLDIFYWHINFDAFLQVMMLKMLEKSQNVEKLTLGERFLQTLSLAEIRGAPFPMLKVKAMTLKTSVSQYANPGIKRLLQNSPDLKKITVHLRNGNTNIPKRELDTYMRNSMNPDQSWRSKNEVDWYKDRADVKSNHVVSFMKLMLGNAEALEELVVRFQDSARKVKKLVQTLLNENNVSIVLSTKPSKNRCDW